MISSFSLYELFPALIWADNTGSLFHGLFRVKSFTLSAIVSFGGHFFTFLYILISSII